MKKIIPIINICFGGVALLCMFLPAITVWGQSLSLWQLQELASRFSDEASSFQLVCISFLVIALVLIILSICGILDKMGIRAYGWSILGVCCLDIILLLYAFSDSGDFGFMLDLGIAYYLKWICDIGAGVLGCYAALTEDAGLSRFGISGGYKSSGSYDGRNPYTPPQPVAPPYNPNRFDVGSPYTPPQSVAPPYNPNRAGGALYSGLQGSGNVANGLGAGYTPGVVNTPQKPIEIIEYDDKTVPISRNVENRVAPDMSSSAKPGGLKINMGSGDGNRDYGDDSAFHSAGEL